MFNNMQPYRIERRERNGKVLYTYADKQRNLVYIGGESEFQRYKQSGYNSRSPRKPHAAQINQETSLEVFGPEFGPYWGPWKYLVVSDPSVGKRFAAQMNFRLTISGSRLVR